jgi:hypothetical protein
LIKKAKASTSTNNEEEETDESKENSFFDKNKSIKSNSPFSSHFNEIHEKINKSICTNLDESTTANELMNSNFIDFLFDNYLPYAFIWSGFVYRCLNSISVTRLTNGTMERHIRTKKSVVPKACLPALYINNTVKLAIGQERIKELNNLNNDEDIESENEYDSNSNSDSGESKAEENASTAEDRWAKTQADKMKIKKRKRKNFTGCYQRPQRIDLVKKNKKVMIHQFQKLFLNQLQQTTNKKK